MELGLSDSSKEQINYATIGNGEIKSNSDINKSQVVTKDENSNLNIYLSNTSVEKALNPNETVAKWTQDFKDMGLNVRDEIIGNLPSATKLDKDGNGNIFDKTIGKALDYNPYGIGIVPSVANGGGYITQIATQLFGDNRTGVVVENKDVLIKAGVSKDDIEEVTLVKTKDGIKRADGIKSTDKILDTVTVYRIDPNKTIIISENQASIDKEKSLSDYNSSKIYLTQDDVKNSGINHLFTNGMYNPFDTAAYNQQTQQSNTNAILNYNQQHGIVGDLMESAQDALVVGGMGLLNSSGATSSNTYLSYLGTGGAKQTGDLINTMAIVTNGNLTVGAHSQGTLMTQVGMQNNIDSLKTIVQDNPNSKLLVGYAGSPVNHNTGETLLSEIYGGSEGIKAHLNNPKATVNDVFRSNVSPQDFVGSFLGGQSAGVNNSEKLGVNMWSSLLSVPMLFGAGGDSSHSYYPCVIGCGNNNTTPKFNTYFNPVDTKNQGQTPLTNYYDTYLPHINKDLLPSSQLQNSQTTIDTTGVK